MSDRAVDVVFQWGDSQKDVSPLLFAQSRTDAREEVEASQRTTSLLPRLLSRDAPQSGLARIRSCRPDMRRMCRVADTASARRSGALPQIRPRPPRATRLPGTLATAMASCSTPWRRLPRHFVRFSVFAFALGGSPATEGASHGQVVESYK